MNNRAQLSASFLRVVICALFLAGSSLHAHGQPMPRSLSPTEQAELAATGHISIVHNDGDTLRYLPPVSESRRIAARMRRANIVSEHLLLIDTAVTDDELLSIYNALRAFSRLAYLEYDNPGTGKTKDLFKDSYAVASEDDLTRIDDRLARSIPDQDELFALQDLPPFGDVLQRYTYHRIDGNGSFRVSSDNVWPITFRGIRTVGPGNTNTDVLVIRGEDYLLLYGVGASRVFTGFGLFKGRIEDSFSGRTDGLLDYIERDCLAPIRR